VSTEGVLVGIGIDARINYWQYVNILREYVVSGARCLDGYHLEAH